VTAPADYRRMFTVWDFHSAASGERVRIVRVTEPMEHTHVHGFQRIAWSGLASSKEEALRIANAQSPVGWAGGIQGK
jgi:hypothetical protein